MKKYIKADIVDFEGVILYRSGSVDPDSILTSRKGVFFANSPDYFYNHPQINFNDDYRAYKLSPNARVWDPEKEFELFEIWGYDDIVCSLSDLEKFGLEDEGDWEIEEGYGVTSTDGLAKAGKQLGYDATVIRHIYYHHGYFDEYAVYNPEVLAPLD